MSFLDIPQMNSIKHDHNLLFETKPEVFGRDCQYIQGHGNNICTMIQSALCKGNSVEDLYEAISSGFHMFSGLKMLVERQLSLKYMVNGMAFLPKEFSPYMTNIPLQALPQFNHIFENEKIEKVNVKKMSNLQKHKDETAYTLSILGQLDGSIKHRDDTSKLILSHPESRRSSFNENSSSSNSTSLCGTDSCSEDSFSNGKDSIFIQEKGSECSRRKRGRKKMSKVNLVCEMCQTKDTPEWRRGPNGPSTLCNACGIRYSNKKRKDKESNLKGSIQRILDI